VSSKRGERTGGDHPEEKEPKKIARKEEPPAEVKKEAFRRKRTHTASIKKGSTVGYREETSSMF